MKILKFFSKTCGPCKVLSKNLREANIDVEEIDIQENQELAIKYNIRSVPTLIKAEGDQVLDRFTGIMNATQLKDWCNELQ